MARIERATSPTKECSPLSHMGIDTGWSLAVDYQPVKRRDCDVVPNRCNRLKVGRRESNPRH